MKNLFFKKALNVLKYLAIYYLSVKMICFAIPKFLFMQFRVLHWVSYTPLVETSKMQHMWSFFGRSYNYNLFIGLMEFLIGVLIVFKRTRLIALLIALGVCTNILILNIEFDIDFAIAHILADFIITVLLLSDYYPDLYKFFIRSGGRVDHVLIAEKSKFKRVFPYIFVITLSVSYFVFACNLRSEVNEDVVGAYHIKSIKINDSLFHPAKGKIGKAPMMFLEYNNQIVLSMNDTVYYGNYILNKDSIKINMYQAPGFSMKSVNGFIKDRNSIMGVTENKRSFQLDYKRVDGKKNYLNELYR